MERGKSEATNGKRKKKLQMKEATNGNRKNEA